MEIGKLHTTHSKCLYLIAKMFGDGEISHDEKIKLKYLVFLEDSRLFDLWQNQKNANNADIVKKDLKSLAHKVSQEELEEMLDQKVKEAETREDEKSGEDEEEEEETEDPVVVGPAD